MHTGSDTAGSVSGLRRGILFLLVLAVTASLFGTVFPVQAAAANYNVKAWKGGNMYNYQVYQGSEPSNDEPTFCRYNTDEYRGGNITITFYWQYDNADEAKAEALWRYLGRQAEVKWKSWSGSSYWVGLDSQNTNRVHYVWFIEGWNMNTDPVSTLCENVYTNANGDRLYMEHLDYGDVITNHWSDIWDAYECSAAFYAPNQKASIGFQFIDEDGYPTLRYNPVG